MGIELSKTLTRGSLTPVLSADCETYISLPRMGSCAPRDKRRQGVRGMLAKTKNYRPSDKEPFMNERQREYFRTKLLAWREDILKEAKETLQHLQEENQNHPDLADRASSETDRAIELRARDRQRKLIAKIDEALTRI